MNSTTFIYALCEPETRTIRYIGKSSRPERRLSQHCSVSRKCNSYLGHWLDGLHKKSKTPSLLILKEVLETEWQGWERLYICNAAALGFKLVNGTPGGEGGAIFFGPHKPESLAKMRENRPDISGEKNPMFGKNHTRATITKMSAVALGKPRSPVTCAKISATMTGKKHSPATRAEISEARLNKKRPNNTSGFVGVCWHKAKKGWQAAFQAGIKKIFVGCFKKIEDAVFARALALENHLTNAVKNNT